MVGSEDPLGLVSNGRQELCPVRTAQVGHHLVRLESGGGSIPLSGFVEEGKTQPGPRREIKQSAPGPRSARHPRTGHLAACLLHLQQPLAETVLLYSFSHLLWRTVGVRSHRSQSSHGLGYFKRDRALGVGVTDRSVEVWIGVRGSGALAFSLVQRQEDVRLTLESPSAVELPLAALQVRGHIFDTQGLGRRWRLRARPCPTSSRHPPPAGTHKAPYAGAHLQVAQRSGSQPECRRLGASRRREPVETRQQPRGAAHRVVVGSRRGLVPREGWRQEQRQGGGHQRPPPGHGAARQGRAERSG